MENQPISKFTVKNKTFSVGVGDDIITADGRAGKIVSICACDQCEKRGFNEIIWAEDKLCVGVNYITKYDYDENFYDYHRIGNCCLAAFRRDSVAEELATYKNIVAKLQNQLKYIDDHNCADSGCGISVFVEETPAE